MQNRFEDSGFARLYTWVAKAKYTMGILFLALTLVYLLFGLLWRAPATTMDFFTALEMMFACFFVGILQQAIVPKTKLTRLRCALWVLSGLLITLAFSLVFGWFSAFPLWYVAAFFVVLALGMVAVVLGDFLELRRQTRALNRQLEKFQNRPGE